MSAMVSADRVCKRFGAHLVLRDVSMEVQRGEVTCLLGPSGSGKSTLLRCINNLEAIDAGRLWVNDELVGFRERGKRIEKMTDAQASHQRAGVGMVFQAFNLFPHMDVMANICLAQRRVRGRDAEEARERASELLARVGLADRERAYPKQLSGGQQQRVAIARALALDPQVMLFDEPTSALDPELVGEVLNVMGDLAHSGMTMLVVSHEIAFAREAADSVAFLSGGRLLEHGTPQQVLGDPLRTETRDFLRRVL